MFLGGIIALIPMIAQAQLNFSSKLPVHLDANHVEYFKKTGIVIAIGNVHIKQGAVNLYADKIIYNVVEQTVRAQGHVMWQMDQTIVHAQVMKYNLATKSGEAEDIKTIVPPWFCSAPIIRFKKNKIILKNARFTSCDYPQHYQHYHLTASSLEVVPGKSLVANNVVIYIGRVPVFYLPIFARNLRDWRVPFQFNTGSSAYLGQYVLLTTNYLFNPENYGSIYTDYFTNKGIGLGIREEVALNKYSTLSLYGYRVQEKDTGQVRWESHIEGRWALNSDLQGRIELFIPGDGLFSQEYAPVERDPSITSTERQYDISETLEQPNYTLGVLIQRQEEVLNPLLNPSVFTRSQESLPQINFDLFPQNLFGNNWLKYDFNASLDRQYTIANNFYTTQFSSQFGLSQSYMPTAQNTFYSRVALQDNYQNVSDVGTNDAGNTALLDLTATWNTNWSYLINTQFSYTYDKKLSHILSTDPPGGVTDNSLVESLQITASSSLRSVTSDSVNFLQFGNTLLDKFSYLNEQFFWTESTVVNFFTIADYSLVAKQLKDVNGVFTLTSPENMWQFKLAATYENPQVTTTGMDFTQGSPQLDITTNLEFVIFTNYRVSVSEDYDVEDAQFVDRTYSIYRDLHDWEAELDYSDYQGQGRTLMFKLDLKAFPGRPLTVSQNSVDQWEQLRSQNVSQITNSNASQFE